MNPGRGRTTCTRLSAFSVHRSRARTRARLDPVELVAEIGPLTVPPPEQQPSAN